MKNLLFAVLGGILIFFILGHELGTMTFLNRMACSLFCAYLIFGFFFMENSRKFLFRFLKVSFVLGSFCGMIGLVLWVLPTDAATTFTAQAFLAFGFILTVLSGGTMMLENLSDDKRETYDGI